MSRMVRLTGIVLLAGIVLAGCREGGGNVGGNQQAVIDQADDICFEAQTAVGATLGDDPAADRDAIRKAICALANDLTGAGGGDLVIGVDKVGRPVSGVDVSDAALLRITEYRDEGRILDRPSIVVAADTYQGHDVIRVRVNASRTPPVRFDNVVYVRPGPTTRRANRDDERILSERRRVHELPFDVRAQCATLARGVDCIGLAARAVGRRLDDEALGEMQDIGARRRPARGAARPARERDQRLAAFDRARHPVA